VKRSAKTRSGATVKWEESVLFPELEPVGPSDQLMEVFNFWIAELRHGSPTRIVLSDKRRRKIEQALKLYDVQTCKDAILGCKQSDFHMGRNGVGKKYDDIELILRDPEHVERFAGDFRSKGINAGEPF
jgi:hypothetical protein